MTTYSWNVGTNGDWGTSTDWTPTGIPGSGAPNIDFAALQATVGQPALTVTIGSAESYDLVKLTTIGPVSLDVSGILNTNTLSALGGSGSGVFVSILSGGTFEVHNQLSASAPESISIDRGATLVFGDATKAGLNINNTHLSINMDNSAGIGNGGTIVFAAGPAGFVSGESTSQKITNATGGDAFVFSGGPSFVGDSIVYDPVAHNLSVNDPSTGETVVTMNSFYAAAGTTFAAGPVGTIDALCFAAGTRIRTARGDRAVESLREGDMVVTVSGGEQSLQPVKWIGRRRFHLSAHPRPETVSPIRIQRHAFAENVPYSDLVVSPDHAIYADGKLICARQLVNGTTIRQELGQRSVTYFHVELESHAILLAEGLPSESYLNTGNRGCFANSSEPLDLYPDLLNQAVHPLREQGSCAPFVWQEDDVRPVWEALASRAADLGQLAPVQETTTDPALAIVANGRTLQPLVAENGHYQFMLPSGVKEVRIVSRTASPGDAKPWMEDRRRLGVYVERIMLRDENDVQEVPLDHPSLSQSWWAVEGDGQNLRRWTGGAAVVPLPDLIGPAVLELTATNSGLAYVLDGGRQRGAASPGDVQSQSRAA